MKQALHVQSFGSDSRVADVNALEALLSQRVHGANLFTIGPPPGKLPRLNVFVRGGQAVLYYIPAEEEMYASVGQPLEGEAAVEFLDGPSPLSTIDLPAVSVIPWQTALPAVIEFATTLERPDEITWERIS